MTEIILDLEWNGTHCASIGAYFNEIIEIGAVKMDARMQIVDEFHATIRPTVSKKLTSIVKNLTHITEEELSRGTDFRTAFARLAAWASEKPMALLTWSNTDLTVLLENLKYYQMGDTVSFITHYADIQPYCQRRLGLDSSQQVSLENACEAAGIRRADTEWHRALDDSRLTALLLGKVYVGAGFAQILLEANAEFYKRFSFKSVTLSDPNDPAIDKAAFRFTCPDCGKSLRAKGKFRYTHRAFCCELTCPECHKKYMARVQCKRHYDGVNVRRKLSVKKEKPKPESGSEVSVCKTNSSAH